VAFKFLVRGQLHCMAPRRCRAIRVVRYSGHMAEQPAFQAGPDECVGKEALSPWGTGTKISTEGASLYQPRPSAWVSVTPDAEG
jgi:hypothetical protein